MEEGGKLNMIEYCENRRDENKWSQGKNNLNNNNGNCNRCIF